MAETRSREGRKPDAVHLTESHLELLHYAVRWSGHVGAKGLRAAEEWLNGAVAALYDDKCPPDCPQVAFLKTRIKQSACNYARKQKTKQKAHDRIARDQSEAPEAATQEYASMERQLYDRVIEGLGQLADERARTDVRYDQVSLLICAFGDRLETPKERREVAGFGTQGEYDAAMKRLRTLVQHLPDELRLDAIAFLRGA